MSSLAKQKQEKQMNGYLLSFGVCAAAAFFIFLPFLVVDKGLFQYCGDFNSQRGPALPGRAPRYQEITCNTFFS